jgi:SAM-dependent methyltransferase
VPAQPPPDRPVCAVCGGQELHLHLRVAGAPGPEGLTPATDRFGVALGDIVRCAGCGHMQLDRLPAEAGLASGYAAATGDEYLEEEAGQRATARSVLERLEPRVAGRRLLDVGAWVGFLAAEARDRGWAVRGLEPSAYASVHARERLGLDVVTGDVESADLPPGEFDAVVLGDVIEHLRDPGGALDRVHELLAPGGAVCLMLPDAGSRLARTLGARWWSVVPTHVHYFTRASMRALLVRHGFDVLELGTHPKAFSVRYYLGRAGGYSRPLARLLVAAAERLGVADRLWAPDFHDRMLVLGRRR